MSGKRTVAEIVVRVSFAMVAVSIVGFLLTLAFDRLVSDDYDAYGKVPVPGSSSLHLPAGDVTVSFYTQLARPPAEEDGPVPVPELTMQLIAPDGVADPIVTENRGGSTTIGTDAHVRMWDVQIPADGIYVVKADGQTNGYINPSLAFGHYRSFASYLEWVFVALFVIGVLGIVAVVVWTFVPKKARPSAPQDVTPSDD
jgi:hypothetical protein